MPFGIDDALMIAGTLLGGLGASGQSPQEKNAENINNTLQDNEDYFKSLPFSKEEIMNSLLPQVQKIYRSSADVVAGRLGQNVGESGVAGGQGLSSYYLSTLAPVIAQGENLAAGAVSDFGKWYSQLDAQAKNRFMQAISLEIQNNGSLPDMNTLQRTISGALSGLNLGATAGGNVVTANALQEKNDLLKQSMIGSTMSNIDTTALIGG